MAKSVTPVVAPTPLVDNTIIATAITAPSAAIFAMRPFQPLVMKIPVLDPFSSLFPFDLSFRSGATSYNVASSPLDQIWDSTMATFLFFVISLRLRAKEGK